MSCTSSCRLCDRLVISDSVTFASGVLTINIPAGSYENHRKYCIVVAQTIPDTATLNAPVVITIGSGTVEYPLTTRNCAQVTASAIRSRTRYSTVVATTATGGTFKLCGNICRTGSNTLTSIDGGSTPAPANETSLRGASAK